MGDGIIHLLAEKMNSLDLNLISPFFAYVIELVGRLCKDWAGLAGRRDYIPIGSAATSLLLRPAKPAQSSQILSAKFLSYLYWLVLGQACLRGCAIDCMWTDCTGTGMI